MRATIHHDIGSGSYRTPLLVFLQLPLLSLCHVLPNANYGGETCEVAREGVGVQDEGNCGDEDYLEQELHLIQTSRDLLPRQLQRLSKRRLNLVLNHRDCVHDSDCAFHHKCAGQRCIAKSFGDSLVVDATIFALVFLGSSATLAAGVGGGGLYVPLMMFVIGLDSRTATATSPALEVGGAISACTYNAFASHPHRPERAQVNYSLAALIGASLMAGAQLGSLLHSCLPSSGILFLLALTLLKSVHSSAKTASRLSEKEAEEEQASRMKVFEVVRTEDRHAPIVRMKNIWAMLMLAKVWVLCLALTAVSGAVLDRCATWWWVSICTLIAFLTVWATVYAFHLSQQEPVDEDDLDFRQLAFPLLVRSLIAGVIAAVCGIGGGMVLSPILVSMNVLPQVSASSMNATLFVLSSSTLLVYSLQGAVPLSYAGFLACATMAGALTGKYVLGGWVQRLGKQSILVWVLTIVILLALCFAVFDGVLQIIDEPVRALSFVSICAEPQLVETVSMPVRQNGTYLFRVPTMDLIPPL